MNSQIFARARRVISIARLKPFDSSTIAGRSEERYRRVAWTTIASVAATLIRILTQLISVPLTLHYLGAERYGLWMTISSVIAILGFADLGMGHGLMNAISEANGKDDQEMAKKYVSSSFLMLSSVAIALAFCFANTYQWIPWIKVFSVTSSQAMAEAGPAMAVFVGCFLVNMPLGIVNQIQRG